MNLLEIDENAFGALVEPYRRELHVHCYRMLGSVQDAEDMVQETFLRAWRRRETFEGRATLRAWLYKIATNACLDALDKRPQRFVPRTRQAATTLEEPIPADVNDPIWLEPYPDELYAPDDQTPERQHSARETTTLAFLTLLHLLPPRQRAVLILRDVLDWQAREVADLCEMTVSAVKSALHRARAELKDYARGEAWMGDARLDAAAQGRLAEYVRAWETADIDTLLVLLKEDATFSMPPIPAWYQGRETIGGLVAKTIFRGEANGRWRLLPTRANGQPAFGLYRLNEQGRHSAYGIQVVTFDGGEIRDIITFRKVGLFEFFGLPMQI